MRRFIIIASCLLVFLISILFVKYIYISKTEVVPYCNLTRFSTSYYYIYCDISYKKDRFTIICGNDKLHDLLTRNKNAVFKFSPIYALWVNRKLKNNISIDVNSEMFSELQYAVLRNEFIQKHQKEGTIDSILISNGKFPKNLVRDDVSAIIYLLLKKGINCRNVCETGDIEVILPNSRSKI